MMDVPIRESGCPRACERGRKRAVRRLLLAAALTVLTCGPALAQPQPDPRATGETLAGQSHENAGPVKEEHEGRGMIDVFARLVNFGILAGTLVYLLRAPIRTYLSDRSTQIRADLVHAAEMKDAAAAQIQDIDRRMQSLPGELDTLRAQGAQEIEQEESRIRTAAAAERDRLLEQARREIDLQVKIAQRALVSHAADLAVGVATDRIRRNITDDDQRRLVDRYVQQLKG